MLKWFSELEQVGLHRISCHVYAVWEAYTSYFLVQATLTERNTRVFVNFVKHRKQKLNHSYLEFTGNFFSISF